jgi:hypothetical protein
MLRPEDVLKQLQKRPFEPFRIHLTDGKTYDVKHPELVITGERFLVVGEPRPGKNGAVAASYDTVTLMHVVRLEPIQLSATNP